MPRVLINIKDDRDGKEYFLEWSTVVDAPVTYGMTLEELQAYYKEEFGRQGVLSLEKYLIEVTEHGCTGFPFNSIPGLISTNRAGKGGHKLTKEQILDEYCINKTA